ncbi:MAG: hypothetical protein ACRDD7_11475 [Peptostreptococcaceae bacterium]
MIYIALNITFNNNGAIKYLNFTISILLIVCINLFIISKFKYLSDIIVHSEKIKRGDIDTKIEVQGNGSFSHLASNLNDISDFFNECILDTIKSDIINMKFLKEVSLLYNINQDDLNTLLNKIRYSITPRLETINLDILVKEVINYHNTNLKEANIQLIYLCDNVDTLIIGDKNILYDVLSEFFNNVLKHSLHSTKCYISIENKANEIHLSIKNISKEDINMSKVRNGRYMGIRLCENMLAIQKIKLNVEIEASLFKYILVFKIESPL